MGGFGLFPVTFALIPTSAVVGIVMSRSGYFLWLIWGGWAVAILGTGLLIFLDVNIDSFNWILIFLVVGLGQGMLLSPINVAAQAACHVKDAASAAAMFTYIRGLGMSVGVVLGGAVLQNALYLKLENAKLESADPPLEIARNAAAFVIKLSEMPAGSDIKGKILHAYAGGFATVFEVLAGVSLLGGVVSLLIEPHSMNKESDTEHMQQEGDVRGLSQGSSETKV
jgi:hypothetical protein